MITEALAYKFREIPGVRIYNNMPDSDGRIEKGLYYFQNTDIQRSLSDYDYVIYGEISADKKAFYIKPRIFDIKFNKNITISTIRGYSGDLFRTFDLATDEIYKTFIEIVSIEVPTAMRIGIIADYPVTKKTKNALLSYIRNLITQVTNDLDSPEYGEIVSWRDMQEFYFNPSVRLNEVVEVKDIDVLIKANFTTSEKDYFVNTIILVSGEEKEINLPELSSSYFRSYDFVKYVNAEYQGLVNNILTSQGDWNLTPFRKLESSNDHLKEYGDEMALNGEFYLSNLMYMRLIENEIKTAELHHKIGNNLFSLKRIEEALLEYNKAIEINPGYASSYAASGRIETELENYKKGIKLLERANKLAPEVYDTKLWLGISYYQAGQYEPAIVSLEQSLELNAEDFESYKYLGLSYLAVAELNTNDNARKYYDRAIRLFLDYNERHPDSSEGSYYFAYALSEKGIWLYLKNDYILALDYFEEAQMHHSFDYVQQYLVSCMLKNQKYEKARLLTDQSVSLNILSSDFIYYDNGLTIRQSVPDSIEMTQEAEQEVFYYLGKHIEFNPTDSRGFYLLGNTYMIIEDFESATLYLEQAIELAPSVAAYQLDLMEGYIFTGNYERSIKLQSSIQDEFYKGNDVTKSDYAISLYLVITAKRMIGEETSFEEKRLQSMIDNEAVRINSWLFRIYKRWLETLEEDDENKHFLLELTEYMIDSGE
ncbi:MAG: tetratricopeptide repeat protein [Bacteroidales bacterium]|nr:tetratricopeptide repeat protein [Bacteroidales bacterium]